MSDTKKVFTESALSDAHTALELLYSHVAGSDAGDGPLPAFDATNTKLCEAILVRTVYALQATASNASRQVMIAAKKGVDAALHTARVARIEAYREIASLSPAVKAILGDKASAPVSTFVPLSDVAAFFPEGMQETDMVKVLHTMNYKLTSGASKDQVKRILVTISADQIKSVLSNDTGTETA